MSDYMYSVTRPMTDGEYTASIESLVEKQNAELEQLRAENERLREALSRIEAVYFLNPPHINQAKAMGIIALDALKEPDNDE